MQQITVPREVQAALVRVHAGSFGICLDCEGEINAKRRGAVTAA